MMMGCGDIEMRIPKMQQGRRDIKRTIIPSEFWNCADVGLI